VKPTRSKNDFIRPTWLWQKCCRDLGIDHRLVKVHFLPVDDRPDWLDPTDHPWGAANIDDGCFPEVTILLEHYFRRDNPVLSILEIIDTIYHELIHIILHGGPEEEVKWLAETICRRRVGYKNILSDLKEKAFEQGLGPDRGYWTMFRWAKLKNRSILV